MNCDSRERLAGVKQLLPDCHITLTAIFHYLLSVKHEKGSREMKDNKRNLRESSIFCFMSKNNCQVITQIKNLKRNKQKPQTLWNLTRHKPYVHLTWATDSETTKQIKTWSIGWWISTKLLLTTKGKDPTYWKCRFMNDWSIYTRKLGYSYNETVVSPTVSNPI